MVGVQENNMCEIKNYLLADYNFLDQMHDEIIDDIVVNENQVELVFNSLHFPHIKNYKTAKIIFNDLEDANADAYFNIFLMDRGTIKNGYCRYIDEILPDIKKKTLKFEIIDITVGYNMVMILGKTIRENNERRENFQLVISTKKISYIFSD